MVQELRREHDHTRREAADLRMRLAAGAATAPVRSFVAVAASGIPAVTPVMPASDVSGRGFETSYPSTVVGPFVEPASLQDYIAFLTPVGESVSLAKDVLSLLKLR